MRNPVLGLSEFARQIYVRGSVWLGDDRERQERRRQAQAQVQQRQQKARRGCLSGCESGFNERDATEGVGFLGLGTISCRVRTCSGCGEERRFRTNEEGWFKGLMAWVLVGALVLFFTLLILAA